MTRPDKHVGQQPQFLQLLGAEQVGYVDQQHDAPPTLPLLGASRLWA